MKKIIKYFIYLFVFLFFGLGIMIWFSPYGKNEGYSQNVVMEKIIIDAPINKLYTYIGNSDNAKEWSVYVDHIIALNSNTHNDGETGSIRRCFKNKDESGIYWDEEILINEKNKRRRLNIYNMQNFSMSSENLLTEQLYTEIGDKTEVCLSLFFINGKSSWIEELKLYLAAYQISSIFRANLERIKMLNEK